MVEARKRLASGAPPQEPEEDFPRGGGSALTALERRQLRQEAAAEAERDFAAGGGSGRKRRKTTRGNEGGEELFFAREAMQGKLPKFVELLKFKSLTRGAKIWGAVSEIAQRELIISLPHGLRGHVPAEETSAVLQQLLKTNEQQAALGMAKARTKSAEVPSLGNLFHVGQLVRCTVEDLQDGDTPRQGGHRGKKRIMLSLHVAKVNAGLGPEALAQGLQLAACVRSVEDHGFLLDIGVQGVSAFMERANWVKACGGEAKALHPGALLEVIVTAGYKKGKKLVHVSADPKALSKAVAQEWEGLSIGSLLPGMLVNARVRNVLADGLLVSFLTYFNGTVDCFHLSQELPDADWTKGHEVGTRVRARVIYVDPVSKRLCLSLLPHLVAGTARTHTPPINTLFKEAVVRRVDEALGLLLELPLSAGADGEAKHQGKKKGGQQGVGTEAAAAAGYVHISNVSDSRVEKLDKAFKVGQKLRARVIGARPMDGLAVCSLKESVVGAGMMSYADITPGSLVSGTVDNIEDFGLFVKLAPSVKALVPLVHLSDTGSKPGAAAKYKEGQKVTGRVLECDPSSKRITLSLKKLLMGDKLPPFTTWEEAEPGHRAHGYVTGVYDYGVFVAFCNGIKGLAPASQLGLEPSQDPAKHFTIGKTVKARVLSSNPVAKRMRLSLKPKSAADVANGAVAIHGEDPLGGLQPGDFVEGSVRSITTKEDTDGSTSPAHYLVELVGADGAAALGRLDVAHLADHPTAQAALAESVTVGARLGRLLVLDRMEKTGMVKLTRKASLLAAAAQLPSGFSALKGGALLPGYVASVTADSVFVRFLGNLTGRAGLAQLSDQFVSDPQQRFSEGQSVRTAVATIDAAKQRFSVSLKRSLTGSYEAEYLRSLFADLEAAEHIRLAAEGKSSDVDWERLPVGGLAEGSVHEVKEYGIVCDLEAHPDLVGVATHEQAEDKVKAGDEVTARILEVNKKDGIVDLSLKAALVLGGVPAKRSKAGKTKKSKEDKANAKTPELEVGDAVEAVVELVKPDYVVLSLPNNGGRIAFAAASDTKPGAAAQPQFNVGQKFNAVVSFLAAPETGGRTILQLSEAAGAAEAAAKPEKRSRKSSKPATGLVATATVTSIHTTHLAVILENGNRGRVHITNVEEADSPESMESPLSRYNTGDSLQVVVLGTVATKQGRQHGLLELSARPSLVVAAAPERGDLTKLSVMSVHDISAGETVRGYVQEVTADCAWLVLSPSLRGRLHALDAADDVERLSGFSERFRPGQALRCKVSQVDQERHMVDLSLGGAESAAASTSGRPEPDALVSGQITHISGAGVRILLRGGSQGQVSLTDIHDTAVENALAGLTVGEFVRCRVLESSSSSSSIGRNADGDKDAGMRLFRLSLRPSQGAWRRGVASPMPATAAADEDAVPELFTLSDLKIGQQLQGYIKNVSGAGAFVALGSEVEARVKLNNLADGFVEDPKQAFPEGKLVRGRIIDINHNRLEMSLKTRTVTLLEDMSEGQIVRGTVKRVEKFGVFVRIKDSPITGMAHISEVADEHVTDLSELFKAGQGVRARVLAVDKEMQRVSLGLKPSYFEGEEDDEQQELPDQAGDEAAAAECDDLDADVLEAVHGSYAEEDDWRAAAATADGDGGEDKTIEEEGAASDVDDVSMDDAEPSGSDEEPEAEEAAQEPDQGYASRKRSSDEAGISGGPGGNLHGLKLGIGEGVGWMEEDTGTTTIATSPAEDKGKEAPLTKRQRKRLKQAEEERVRAAELRQLNQPAPESAGDFERLVLESPNSSYVWISYMAFHIGVGETDKARAVAERALKTIHFREEREKLNVWVAYLNLENLHGSEEAVMKLFQRALSYADQKKLYLALITILDCTNRDELAQQTLRAMTRKFSGSAKVCLRAYGYALGKGDAEEARKTLARAIAALPARKHIKVFSQAALAEFKMGDAERGRGIFEGILRNYPKRLDLWSIYLDQEIRLGDQQRTRSLFERATHMSLPPKKMKFLFKRYLDYEKVHGTAAGVDHVKQAAREYVEANLSEG